MGPSNLCSRRQSRALYRVNDWRGWQRFSFSASNSYLVVILRAVLFEVGVFLKRMFYVRIVTAYKVQILCESSTLVPALPQGPLNTI